MDDACARLGASSREEAILKVDFVKRPHSPETEIYLNRGVNFICTGLADRKFCELPD